MCKNVEKHNKEICRLEYWVVGGEMFQPQTSDTPPQLSPKQVLYVLLEGDGWQWFGKKVCWVVLSIYPFHHQFFSPYCFSNKVVPDGNVLGPLLMGLLFCELSCCIVVTQYGGWLLLRFMQVLEQLSEVNHFLSSSSYGHIF